MVISFRLNAYRPWELLVKARDHERGYGQCIACTAHHDALLLEQDVVTAPVIVWGAISPSGIRPSLISRLPHDRDNADTPAPAPRQCRIGEGSSRRERP